MRVEASLFREENVSLQTDEAKLGMEFDRVVGAQVVEWRGEEVTLTKLATVGMDPDRDKREEAWRKGMDRRLADRSAINELWRKVLTNRLQQSQNAGLGDDYRTMRWQLTHRWDYTPANCREFHQAIEEVVVPAAKRVYDRRKAALGLGTLRPWDLEVDASGQPPLKPFSTVEELIAGSRTIVNSVDPVLGSYLETMIEEDLLDLGNRMHKAPGAYCSDYPMAKRPFIFMNAVGTHNDVQTMLHEAGHAFHVFESNVQPNVFLKDIGAEIAEVASMSFELLAGPHLNGTFYNEADAKRAQNEHLEKLLLFWPYMAVVDAFQHWVYENPQLGLDSSACDDEWDRLWSRFMVGVDWSGLDDARVTGWHRKLHIHQFPFYYVEYGLAQLGAVQVWGNSHSDAPNALKAYRHALSLGGSRSLPELYSAAGAKFAFDSETVGRAVRLIESQMS